MAEVADRRANMDDYLERIGYTGPRTASLETLRSLHACHARNIPYENLNPLLGLPVRLDTVSLMEKLVHQRRGGYCFEQNFLFWHMLETLGFAVTGLAARVVWMVPEGTMRPRMHMLLHVLAEGQRYLADVGFGSVTLTAPLLWETDIVQATTLEPFRLLETRGLFTMQALVRDEWRSLYEFSAERYHRIDYESLNWHASTHPESRFVNGLLAARPDVDRRHALLNNSYAVHVLHGETERRTITDPEELRAILAGPLQIRLPDSPRLTDILQRLTASV